MKDLFQLSYEKTISFYFVKELWNKWRLNYQEFGMGNFPEKDNLKLSPEQENS
jgi:hypothetical protein